VLTELPNGNHGGWGAGAAIAAGIPPRRVTVAIELHVARKLNAEDRLATQAMTPCEY
jgi:hypothetical protein